MTTVRPVGVTLAGLVDATATRLASMAVAKLMREHPHVVWLDAGARPGCHCGRVPHPAKWPMAPSVPDGLASHHASPLNKPDISRKIIIL